MMSGNQKYITAGSLVPQLSTFEVERATEKLKNLGIDKIPAELIKARGRKIRSEIHKLILFCFHAMS